MRGLLKKDCDIIQTDWPLMLRQYMEGSSDELEEAARDLLLSRSYGTGYGKSM